MDHWKLCVSDNGTTSCDEFEGHLMYLAQSEESVIKKSCTKTWRSAEGKLVQPRILEDENRPSREETENFLGRRGFFFFERQQSDT